jgi:hypothetical protein
MWAATPVTMLVAALLNLRRGTHCGARGLAGIVGHRAALWTVTTWSERGEEKPDGLPILRVEEAGPV